ncbi:MAG TPA: DUF2779 domain-containing protein [Candidatus Omnitrophota bacterium]|nr:DUF2779 domain-containing protein [Candidatus Omnitrophota bacterium]
MRKPLFLSKSKYIDGLQCPKLLWYEFNRKSEVPGPEPMMRAVMEEGRKVGEVAQKLFPGGVRIERDFDPEKMSARSLKALELGRPLFEAGFTNGRAYAIADILSPEPDGAWDLTEVKSASGMKSEYYDDVAFQKYTYTGAGVKIGKCYLMHLNREYLKRGEIEPDKLFVREDITETVEEKLPGIAESVASMIGTIEQQESPEVKVGSFCSGCPLKEMCWSFLPGSDHVFLLHRAGKVAYELMQMGILKLEDIPEAYELAPRHQIQKKSLLTGKAHVDREEILRFLSRFEYPLFFLDFETIAPAIPIFDLTHPYEEVPFQFSLHVVREKGKTPEHYPFLSTERKDPRPEVLKELKRRLEDKGSIIAYNAKYEMDCIRKATGAYPEYAEWCRAIEPRFIDLWEPFKNFFYYHPDQQNSTSMKSVLPAFTGKGYEGLDIAEGGTARMEYMRVTFGDNIDETDRNKVYSDLLKYCELDTKGMIDILNALAGSI